MRDLIIVGSHSATRGDTPWDSDAEIWAFNEAPQAEWCGRWDVDFQMHSPEVYTGFNHVRADHWDWLQTDHGKAIYMQAPDDRVPGSRVYPLEAIKAMTPDAMLTSTPAQALALALYLGYPKIDIYGIELTSNSEYAYQVNGWVYWVGFARGRGVNLTLHSGVKEHFTNRVYGYEGDPRLTDYFKTRAEWLSAEWHGQDKRLRRIDETINEAMLKNNFQVVAQGIFDLEAAGTTCGAVAGALGEAETYSARNGSFTPRQELEKRAAKAQGEGEPLKALMYAAGGKCEYVWNIWAQTGDNRALQQLRLFVKEKRTHAYDCGARLGIYNENLLYMQEYDARITALGGERAVNQIMEVANG